MSKDCKYTDSDINKEFHDDIELFSLLSKKFVRDYQPYIENKVIDEWSGYCKIPSTRMENDIIHLRRLLNDIRRKISKLEFKNNE